jgi:Carboxypeptidase regulatory-like domain
MKPLVALSLLVLLLLPGCDAFDSITGPDEPVATLSGRVTTSSTAAPYYPASVALIESNGDFRFERVNTDGQYRFRSVQPGSYGLVLTLGEGAGVREAVRGTIEITPGANVRDFVVP